MLSYVCALNMAWLASVVNVEVISKLAQIQSCVSPYLVQSFSIKEEFIELAESGEIIWVSLLIFGLLLHAGAFVSLMLQSSWLLSLTQALVTFNIAVDLYFSIRFLGDGIVFIPDYLWIIPLLTIAMGIWCTAYIQPWKEGSSKQLGEVGTGETQPKSYFSLIEKWYWPLISVCTLIQIALPQPFAFIATGMLALLGIAVYRFAEVYQTETITLHSIKNSYEVFADGIVFFRKYHSRFMCVDKCILRYLMGNRTF